MCLSSRHLFFYLFCSNTVLVLISHYNMMTNISINDDLFNHLQMTKIHRCSAQLKFPSKYITDFFQGEWITTITIIISSLHISYLWWQLFGSTYSIRLIEHYLARWWKKKEKGSPSIGSHEPRLFMKFICRKYSMAIELFRC